VRNVRWARAGLVIPAWVAIAFLLIPLAALLVKVDWGRVPAHLASPIVIPALRLSLMTTTSTLVICMLVGTPLAWMLARSTHRATPWLRALVTVPLVLPPVVGGVALLMAYGREGVVGAVLFDVWGWSIPFTTVAVVFAEVFVALPFYVLAVE